MSKEERIKKEQRRLSGIFKDLDQNKRKAVDSLIKNAAFMAVTLEDLQNTINDEGCIVEFKNSKHQYGTKQSDAVKTHIAMTRNHASIIKQLAELAPPASKQESKLQALLRM